MILGLRGKVGMKIESQTKIVLESEKTLEDLIDYLNQAIKIIQKSGVSHTVIMFDETDKILSPITNDLSVKHAIAFFSRMCPVLSKINCSFIFVLNSQYNNSYFRKEIIGRYFDKIIQVHKIDKKRIRKIIEKRTQAVCGNISVESIWDEDTLIELERFYGKTNLRYLTTACKYAVEKARQNASEKITIFHAKEAISEIKNQLLTVN
jgi:Cdc6-like AAA superfamily ATPase